MSFMTCRPIPVQCILMHFAARHLDSKKKISSLKLYNDNVIFMRTKKTPLKITT